MYERHTHRPISRRDFAWRIARHGAFAAALVAGSLALGMLGYSRFEHLSWLDAFLDAAMLLGGMGPVHIPVTDAGKLFAGFYALFSGMVFLVVAGVMLAPVIHRVLHHFHWAEDH